MKQFIPRRRVSRRSEVWQIIYMDLMTMVMVFFVILWSINQGSDAGVSNSVGDQTARMISLPSDILFGAGRANMSGEGQSVFQELFRDETGAVLRFESGGLTRRQLVIHGHTDSDGAKDSNFLLGYRRAFAAYKEIEKYGEQVADHVILCSHADNTPEQETPEFQGAMTPAQRQVLKEAKAENRRILIEDKIVSTMEEGEEL